MNDPAQRKAFVRQAFERKLFAFATECLGYDRLTEQHEDWCLDFQEMFLGYKDAYIARREGRPALEYTRRRLWLMPRGSYKSTVLTISTALWMLAHLPDLRILILSGNATNAKKFLREIKHHCMTNGKFRSVFGAWNESDRWADTDIVIAPRKAAHKEPSIMTVGKGTEITSAHFDVCLLDDLVTREDRESAAARETSKDVLRDLESIMEDESLMSAVGTHWHFDDAYVHIKRHLNRELRKQGKQEWNVHEQTVYLADGLTPRFPTIYKDLEDLKIKRGLVDFYAQYLNNPLPPDTQLFAESSLAFFDYDPEEYRTCLHYGYWDPASTEPARGKDPDYHAICVLAVRDGLCDLVDVWMKQCKPSEGYAQAVEISRAYALREMRMETNHLPDGADNLEERFRAAGLRTSVSGLKNTISKAVRIESLEPLTSAGRIRFRRDWRESSHSYRLFFEQLTMYPVASHDDGPDALEGAYGLAVKGSAPAALAFTAPNSDNESDLETTFIDSMWSKLYGSH